MDKFKDKKQIKQKAQRTEHDFFMEGKCDSNWKVSEIGLKLSELNDVGNLKWSRKFKMRSES